MQQSFQFYYATPFEQWIEELFQQIGIVLPDQLSIDELASRLNVWVYFLDTGSQAIERSGGLHSVIIDRRLTKEEQWEDFLHELCHVLKHAGDQRKLPTTFIERQEQQAEHFVQYASIPFSMLKRIELPPVQRDATQLIAETFCVTPCLATRRLEQIQRRILQGISDQEFRQQEQTKYRKYDPANWLPETRAMMDKLHALQQKKGIG